MSLEGETGVHQQIRSVQRGVSIVRRDIEWRYGSHATSVQSGVGVMGGKSLAAGMDKKRALKSGI